MRMSLRPLHALLRPLFVLLAFMFSFHTASAAPSDSERLVLAFGDSLTAGYRLKPDESVPVRLQVLLRAQGCKVRIVNAGVSGDTTSGGRARLGRVLAGLGRKPDLAILELGANDMLLGQSARTAEANLDAMLSEFDRRDIPVVVAGLYDSQTVGVRYFDDFNAIYPRVAARHGALLYPFYMKGVVSNTPLLLDDGIHPNAKGADVIARNLLPVIRGELLRLPSHAPSVHRP